MPDHQETSEPILLTLEGNNGKIELMETKVKISLYKECHHLGFGRKFDISKINKVHEIPRDAITKAELLNALGTHQFHIHFPGAGLMGHVNVFIKEEQISEAEKMIKMLTGKDDTKLAATIAKADEKGSAYDDNLKEEQVHISMQGAKISAEPIRLMQEKIDKIMMTAEGIDTKIEVYEEVIKLFDKKDIKDKAIEVPIKDIEVRDLKKGWLKYILLGFKGAGFGGKRIKFSEEHQEEFESLEKRIKEKKLSANSVTSWISEGTAHFNKHEYSEANQVFDKAIACDPNNVQAWFSKCGALTQLGKYDEAIQANNKTIELDPKYARAWAQKGNVLKILGKYDEAQQAFDKSVELDPKMAREVEIYKSSNFNGGVLYNLGKYDEAIQACDGAIEVNPQDANAWNYKGAALFKQGKLEESQQAFDTSVELDPKLAKRVEIFKHPNKNTNNPRPEKENKNIAKILQRRSIPLEKVVIAVEGANGQIVLTDTGVIIGREGIGNKMLVGFTKGEKFLPYRNIAGVQFKEPGITWGYIQFTLPGGIERRGGSWDAGSDENTVTFNSNVLESFRKIRNIIEERQGLGTVPMPPTPQAPARSSIVDELTKLAALKRDGAITEEEYAQLKKDLMSNH